MSFSLLFLTGRINLLYARTLINSSYKRFASGLAIATICINENDNKIHADFKLTTNEAPIKIEY